MSYYQDNPILSPLPNGKDWEIYLDWTVDVIELGAFTIPKGVTIDFASIPRLLWSIVGSPARGMYRNASIVHDYLYSTKVVKRKKADEIFYWCMLEDGVPKWKAFLMYNAVRSAFWNGW